MSEGLRKGQGMKFMNLNGFPNLELNKNFGEYLSLVVGILICQTYCLIHFKPGGPHQPVTLGGGGQIDRQLVDRHKRKIGEKGKEKGGGKKRYEERVEVERGKKESKG